MTPVCGFCQGEMADLDFHLEGKCQMEQQKPDISDCRGGSFAIASGRPAPSALPQAKSCACGCGMEISTLGTTLTIHDYAHWIVRNFNVSCSAQYLGDSQKPQTYKVTYSPDAVVTFRDIPWNLADEAASPIKDINWSIDADIHRVKSWACKRGHSFQSEKQTVQFRDANGNMAESGPLCWLCVIDFLNREFPAFEVKDG